MSLLNTLKYLTRHPLNRSNKLGAIVRFVKWQIGSRLVPGAVVYDWIKDSRFLVRTGELGITANIYTGLFEFPEMAFLLHALREDDVFVDVGANVGSYTILACSAVGARGYAFEPVPSTYKKLVDNVRLNHMESRVKCLNVGVGNERGSISFTTSMGPTNHAVAPGEQSSNTIEVEVSTLDEALGDSEPTLMKIDVEGYETLVLEGATEALQRQSLHSVIIELNGSGSRYGFDESRIVEMMFDFGFKAYSYDPMNRTLSNLNSRNPDSDNTLFIRNEAEVSEKLRNAPRLSIHGTQF